MELYQHFRSQLRLLNVYDLHKKLINHYVLRSERSAKFKRDIDVIRENHKFLWDDEEPSSWEEQLAKKYYDRLYKEYCICDLSRYKEGKVALRWQIEAELVTGKGQFVCGEKSCAERDELKTWEVNFGYVEHEEKKNALVKLRLCPGCSYKLNYKHKRKEIKRGKKRKTVSLKDLANEPMKIPKIEERIDEAPSPSTQSESSSVRERSESIDGANEIKTEDDQNNVWRRANAAVEEKSRDKDFEEFLEELLL